MNDLDNPYAAPDHGLDVATTEQGPGKQYGYLGFWKRVVASIIDNILIGIAFAPLAMILPQIINNPKEATLIYNFLSVIFTLTIILLFWQFKQATPGKMVFSAKIVDADTLGKPSLGKYIIRYIGYIPSSLAFGLGFLWVAWDKKKRGWHDMMAGTLVITPGDITQRRRSQRPKAEEEPQDKWTDAHHERD